MRLPPIPSPHRYAGLFVYDFGTHVSVGYTALEVRYLKESRRHRNGTAYQIYRVNAAGGLELRGVTDEMLVAKEAMCFLRRDSESARRDYEHLRAAADADPIGAVVGLELAALGDFDPPHVTALTYAAAASNMVSAWLSRHAAGLGDHVVGGVEAYGTLVQSEGARIESSTPAAATDYTDRSFDEVLRTVDRVLQR